MKIKTTIKATLSAICLSATLIGSSAPVHAGGCEGVPESFPRIALYNVVPTKKLKSTVDSLERIPAAHRYIMSSLPYEITLIPNTDALPGKYATYGPEFMEAFKTAGGATFTEPTQETDREPGNYLALSPYVLASTENLEQTLFRQYGLAFNMTGQYGMYSDKEEGDLSFNDVLDWYIDKQKLNAGNLPEAKLSELRTGLFATYFAEYYRSDAAREELLKDNPAAGVYFWKLERYIDSEVRRELCQKKDLQEIDIRSP